MKCYHFTSLPKMDDQNSSWLPKHPVSSHVERTAGSARGLYFSTSGNQGPPS